MNRKFYSLPLNHIEFEKEENNNLLRLKIYAISDEINRNKSEFLYSSFESAIPTIYNRPILAYFNEKIQDTEAHNTKLAIDKYTGEVYYDYNYSSAEKPVGTIPESASITIERFMDKNWIVIDGGLIWTSYNRSLTRVIKRQLKKKVSVEIEVLDSYMDGDIEKITSFQFLGVTILGKTPDGKTDVQEGIEHAHMHLSEYIETDNFKKYAMAFNYAQRHNFELSKSETIQVIANMELENGNGEPIKISLTKESASNSSWGSVDKTKLRNDILNASNYKILVNSCYLLVGENWEESPSESLGYPICQIVGGKLVYNIQGINNACVRLEGQEDQPYYNSVHTKLMKIRKKLGLGDDRKHIKFEKGGSTLMKEQFEKLFAIDGKYKYISSTEKAVLAFELENKKFVVIPFASEEETVVMEEAKDAEVYAKCTEPDGDEEEPEKVEMACNEEFVGVFAEVEDSKKELEATKEEMAKTDEKVATLEAEKCEMAEKVEMAEKEKEEFTTEKVEMEAKVATLESEKTFALAEVKKFKEIQFAETLKDLTRQYKLSTDESKEWETKFETFSEVKDLEVAVVMQSHEKQKQFVADDHIKLGGVVKVKSVDRKRAVDRVKENLNNK